MTAFEFVSINPFVGTNLRCPSGGYLRLSTSRRKDGQYRTVTLLGHSKLESTVRYLGIEVDDALEISEQTEI